MVRITFNAQYGDVVKLVHVREVLPASNSYQVTIDNYFHADVYKKDGEWRAHHNSRSDLTMDDIQAIGERIDAELNKH